jgi:hypothetical protein
VYICTYVYQTYCTYECMYIHHPINNDYQVMHIYVRRLVGKHIQMYMYKYSHVHTTCYSTFTHTHTHDTNALLHTASFVCPVQSQISDIVYMCLYCRFRYLSTLWKCIIRRSWIPTYDSLPLCMHLRT